MAVSVNLMDKRCACLPLTNIASLQVRAGRRGMDVRGAAVIPYSPWEPFEDSFRRITGELLPVTSSFVIRYNSILNLWRPGDVKHLRRICASSLREYQRYVLWEQRELIRLEKLEQRAQKSKKAGKKKGLASEGATQAMEQRRKRIGAYPLSRAGAAELEGTIFALRALGYIDERDELTLRGRLLRGIFHPAGIMIVELILGGAFDELAASELAEVCSWFTFDNDRRLNNHNVLNNHLMQVRRELWRIAQHVHNIEQQANIGASPSIVPDFHGVALSWSRGMSLSGLLKRIDLAEGDLLMLLNQTIDLLQQVQSAVGQALDARDIWIQESDFDEAHSTAHKKQSRTACHPDYKPIANVLSACAPYSHRPPHHCCAALSFKVVQFPQWLHMLLEKNCLSMLKKIPIPGMSLKASSHIF